MRVRTAHRIIPDFTAGAGDAEIARAFKSDVSWIDVPAELVASIEAWVDWLATRVKVQDVKVRIVRVTIVEPD